MLVANPKLPASSLNELIALAKAKPGSLNYGMSGVGNPLHLTMEMLKRAAGIDIQAVPYRGDAPLNTALIAGEIEVAVVPMATARAADRERPAARAGGRPAPSARRRCPTCRPSPRTHSGLRIVQLAGLFRAGEYAARHRRAHPARRQGARAPDVLERLKAAGNEPVGSTPEEFDALFKADLVKFAKIVKEAHIPVQD